MKIEELLKTNEMPEAKKLVLNIIVTANYLSEGLAEILKPFEISSQQFNVLRILRGQQGKPANLSTIQERMVSKMSNTTRLVDKLVDKNLCARIVCPSNRRKIEIRITELGLKLLEKLDPLIKDHEESIAKKINEKEILSLNTKLNELRN
ncbi:MarR family winged helix-turn-helix transcriptional regulator [Christiangramia echinicola]|uniref:DNA-binding transcriptional regulator, MarR family n=1 Tax=Christiangramia echinicola TaxID=279359 RepID=A0A1H1PJE9_9FLAO|nr:MarR family transcriptional regulator [Christiangramia echinicola]SDS11412.1 DNA-binding transcriptional regulator, MarR family [Christiangramia echinicola]